MDWFFEYIFPIFFIITFMTIIVSFIGKNFGISFRSLRMFDTFDRINSELDEARRRRQTERTKTPGSYECPHCGANLAGKADVSPSGDVKCRYCNQWFNIHKNSR